VIVGRKPGVVSKANNKPTLFAAVIDERRRRDGDAARPLLAEKANDLLGVIYVASQEEFNNPRRRLAQGSFASLYAARFAVDMLAHSLHSC